MDHQTYVDQIQVQETRTEAAAEDVEIVEDFDYKLIRQVQIYPHLYNNKRKIREQQLSTWTEIAKSLGKTENECEKRWIRLRQYYNKERARRESGQSDYKWQLFEIMGFLIPFVRKKSNVAKNQKERNKSPEISKELCSTAKSSNSEIFNKFEDVEIDFNIDQVVNEQTAIISDVITSTDVASADIDAASAVDDLDITLDETPDSNKDNQVYKFPSNNCSTPSNNDRVQELLMQSSDILNTSIETLQSSTESNVTSQKFTKRIKEAKLKDEENNIIAELVHNRLKKCTDIYKRNNLIIKIMNIIFN